MTIYSYPSVYAIGHKSIQGIFNDPVIVEEKIDGSQFSMGVIDGELQCRSKGKQLLLEAPEEMFKRAVEVARFLAETTLHPNWIYRCEYLEKPKHNTLSYSRVPKNNLILFDVCTGLETYLSYADKAKEAERIGLEVVPLLYEGKVDTFEIFQSFLERESILGGTTIEGVVIKNYSLMTMEKKFACGKYVSEKFKEENAVDFRARNPHKNDVVRDLILQYHNEARWNKAIQHLREAGKLEGSPRDIGPLIQEIPNDILKECEGEIRDRLFTWCWPQIKRGIIAGFPEFYKDQLAKSAFEKDS
jgi:ATP-dependent RNA circularization protein (DNA/RNA ligase family)